MTTRIEKQEVYYNTSTQSGKVPANNANTQLREAFSYYNDTPATTPQKFDINQLDYSNFPKKNRLDAYDFATRSFNEIKDAAREFNADYPQQPYMPNYSNFPEPKNFTKQVYGGNREAYTAWKSAVKEWVEDCKQDMVTAKSNHIGSMENRLEGMMSSGFFQVYMQLGITREEIQQAFEDTKGDINQLKEQLDKRANELRRNIQAGVASINRNTNQAVGAAIDRINANTDYRANEIHQHIGSTEDAIHDHIEGSQLLLNEVNRQIQEEIHADGKKTRDQVKALQSEIMKKLEKMPTKKSLVLDFIKGTLHLPVDIAATGFNLASYLLSLPASVLKQISELLS